ncbi:BrnA antitoxin family protein [uncultured Pseudomonas sp.]|uniref:BrnA antitoxin family protein n=1 Tax=uncultured Pseudomonas sp. TaxID=114707 RepID=UPI0030DC1A37|tara:strand:- start:492 stop:776 length:285 start_codon:yes stop_codon:yes gene_type:complete
MSKRPNPELIDDTNPEWTDDEFKRAVPFNKLPASLQGKVRGRPKAEVTKERITIRLSTDVLDAFKQDGTGWQTRIDEALKQFLKEHKDNHSKHA